MKKANLLDIHNVTAFQGDTQVFNQLNLSINHGESLAILGPNGSGKSTLMKLLTRDIYPVEKTESYLRINGNERININELRKLIGWVSYDLQTHYPDYTTALDVVLSGFFGAFGMLYHHTEVTDQHIQQAKQTIDNLHLSALQERRYHDLSTGEQRRFLLARAMIHQPQTLILDEPTSNLDINASYQLIAHLRELYQKDTAIILATHHIQEILPEIDRVVLMKAGKIIADGSKKQHLTSNTLSDLYDTPISVIEHQGFYQMFPAQ